MILIDSVGWIEFFSEGPLASYYEKYVTRLSEVIVPTIILYEVYKKCKREKGEQAAMTAVLRMRQGRVIPLTEELSLSAGDLSLQCHLSMANAIVYATAIQEGAVLITSDKDLKDLPHVTYYPKPA